MAEWVKLCAANDAPQPDTVTEAEVSGVAVCLANIGGRLHALDNWCPHRRGPLGQGWVEDGAVICPWHAWAFDATSGEVRPPDCGHVSVFPLRIEGPDVLVYLG